jgi:hypothetical protein
MFPHSISLRLAVMASFESLLDVFLQSVKCLAGTRGIIYTTVPITSGYNLFKMMNEHGVTAEECRKNSRYSHQYLEDVVDANALLAASWAEQARNAFPGKVVLDPSQLSIPAWGNNPRTQELYYELWDQVIAAYAHTVIATPKWAFSLGSRKEIEIAIRAGLRVTDLIGDEYSVDDLISHDSEARRELKSWNWSAEKIEESLPRLVVDLGSTPRPPSSVRDEHWHEIFSWVHEDIVRFGRERLLYMPLSDDERTRLSFDSADGWKVSKFDKYWQNMVNAGLDLENGLGRLELASMCVCAVSALQSSVRLHGPLPSHIELKLTSWKHRSSATTTSFDYSNIHELNRIANDVFTWIQLEHKSMREMHPTLSDDVRTREFVQSPSDSSWQHELWNEYLAYVRSKGLQTVEGRYHLGQFTTGSLRLLESAVRLYGPVPARKIRDVTRQILREENSGVLPVIPGV